jgi:hypothetical protein
MSNLKAISSQLAERNQWVLWREEQRDDDSTKMPYQSNGNPASTTDPDHWMSPDEAEEAFAQGDFSGAGYVFSPDDPFVGIDLDHCIEDGDLKPWAQEIVDRLDSYTEKSPSGDGVHIIVKGELPSGGNRRENVEMYDAKRYFTVTGKHVEGTPEEAKDRQDVLAHVHREYIQEDTPPDEDESPNPDPGSSDSGGTDPEEEMVPLSDEELLEKIRGSNQAHKFQLLWSGDTSFYDSPSEADLALAGILAFWTGGDPERVDRLFRQSDLYREKWDRDTYRNKTLSTALDQEEYYTPESTDHDGNDGILQDAQGEGGGKKHADRLLEMAKEAELDVFEAKEGQVYASFPVDGHRETHQVGKDSFEQYLRQLFFDSESTIPSSQAVSDAKEMLKAEATLGGETKEVHTRVARGEDGALYIDLCDPYWRAIKVTPEGWGIVENPPVYFRRTNSMEALPIPDEDGDIRELFPFVNASKSDVCLVVSWLVGAFRPEGPYPLLVLQGEQGSAKSTLARFLRRLIDPSPAPLRAVSDGERDLMISAQNSHVIAFDNVSGLSQSMSDSLCRLATGGGFATRTLYSDSEETIINAMRPIILTGIENVATRDDLAERSFILSLQSISEEERKTERELEEQFATAAPKILGGILDALVAAERYVEKTNINGTPRMADFAEWVSAAEPSGLPWIQGLFLKCHEENRSAAVESSIENHPLARGIRDLLENQSGDEWTGTATELKEQLDQIVPDPEQSSDKYPPSPNWLSRKLKRVKKMLREVGIGVSRQRDNNGRRIRIRKLET